MMLRSARTILGSDLLTRDSGQARVTDVLFDETCWITRYLVVRLGPWWLGRHVLISPEAIWGASRDGSLIAGLTATELERLPDASAHPPIGKRREREGPKPLFALPPTYSGTPMDWPLDWAEASGPILPTESESPPPAELHLQSARETTRYACEDAEGASVGRLADFLLDPRTWALRYAVLGRGRWPRREWVAIAPEWIRSLDWAERQATLALSSRQILRAAEYRAGLEPERRSATDLEGYFGLTPSSRSDA